MTTRTRTTHAIRGLSAVFVALAFVALAPHGLQAQDADGVYTPADLSESPALAAPSEAARLIQDSYPAKLRDAGIEGSVQMSLVVGTDGSVEPGSVQVLSSTVEALSAAASQVAAKIRFKPGKVEGKAVRVRVVLPLVYKVR